MNNPISITTVNDHERLPKGQKKILIDRDDDYNLRAILNFEDDNYIFAASRSAKGPGIFIETFEVSGSDYMKHHLYTLESSISLI